MINAFEVARLPHIHFGEGRFKDLPDLIATFGSRLLLLTGAESLTKSDSYPNLLEGLEVRHLECHEIKVDDEPSPEFVDQVVAEQEDRQIRVVVGVGGGSVIDAAKAIAALLPHGNSVLDHLEGVGHGIPYLGPSTPTVAVPTTAGTGSEVTRNAVLSRRGPGGFKKSFRHEALIPSAALVDPMLTWSCPPQTTAASGMDALTQLLESYVSRNASPFTDALAWEGLELFKQAISDAYKGDDSPQNQEARKKMSMAALLSGITLTNARLGAVHGLASPLGAFFTVPHGAVCGTLVAKATEVNLRALQQRAPDHQALQKYIQVANLFTGIDTHRGQDACQGLVDYLRLKSNELNLPRLGSFGVEEKDIPNIVAHARGGSMKSNPIELTDDELTEILEDRI